MANEVMQLPPNVVSRGLDAAQWNTLCNSIFPGAKVDSVLMYVDYCRARKLDIMKKPAHIVPMRVKQGDNWVWRDVVMPGIYEYRTTAQRTGFYLGHTDPEFGPEIEYAGVRAPEYVRTVFKRWNPIAGMVAEFPVITRFEEVVGMRDNHANDRWSRAPVQMLLKCNEAAGLREAFPDEFGGTMTIEEMSGRVIDVRAAGLTDIEGEAVEVPDVQGAESSEFYNDEPPARGKPATAEPEATPTPGHRSNTATEAQRKMIYAKLKRANIPLERYAAEMGYKVDETPFDEVNGVLKWIEKNASN